MNMMKRSTLVGTLLILLSSLLSCSRKPEQTAPPPPEVLVTTVKPQDVPRVLERVATLDGFINANINAQVQGYIVSRDYQEGGVVKKGDLYFRSIRARSKPHWRRPRALWQKTKPTR